MERCYDKCNLCMRKCGVNRARGDVGYCRMTSEPTVARASLHAWEEPIISGTNGSGTIFFSGCSLGCIFCQNREISRGERGKIVSVDRLAEIMTELSDLGAHNINFVTPTHFIPTVRSAILKARESGLDIPIVYNTSSYDNPEALKLLSGLVDIYLPDFKYYLPKTAKSLSLAENYPEAAKSAIAEMVRQQPTPVIEGGLMKRGVIVRILLLPGHVAESKLILKYVYDTYGDGVYVSLMSQYTPIGDMPAPLNRRVTHREYSELVEYAQRLGLKNAFTQEYDSARESFIPSFDGTGV